jgi:predicted neuraminidase
MLQVKTTNDVFRIQVKCSALLINEEGQKRMITGEWANRPTPQCHASTIAETPAGLVAAWFGGIHEGNPDVGIWVSNHHGETWSTPCEVANGVQSPAERYPCWNPVLFQPHYGPLLLFYKVGPDPEQWWGMLITSDDHGRSWSKPEKLGFDSKIGHLIGPVKNKPIELGDGSILCPSSTERYHLWCVHFELTRDWGKTWEVIGPINDGMEYSAIQPSILRYPDGRMQILCRSQQQVLVQSWSEDGLEWGKITATSLPNPNSGTDAVTLRNYQQLLVYNNTRQGRSPLNVAISSDGIHWKDVLVLEDQQGEFSYPAVIQASDSMVHITYTYCRQAIKHVVVDPSQFEVP